MIVTSFFPLIYLPIFILEYYLYYNAICMPLHYVRMTYHVCFDCVNALLTITICANIFVKLYLTMLKKQKNYSMFDENLAKIWRRFKKG